MSGDKGRMLGRQEMFWVSCWWVKGNLANQSGGPLTSGCFGAEIKEKIMAQHSIQWGSCCVKNKWRNWLSSESPAWGFCCSSVVQSLSHLPSLFLGDFCCSMWKLVTIGVLLAACSSQVCGTSSKFSFFRYFSPSSNCCKRVSCSLSATGSGWNCSH